MSNWVGGNGNDPPSFRGYWGLSGRWKVYRKITEMLNPGPVNTFVLLDERHDSINDGYFVVEMDGYPNLASTQLIDYPASYHGNAGGFSFADGHAEIHKWKDSRTMPPLSNNLSRQNSPNNRDVLWMQDHSSHDHD